jgi:hypothetical protein
MNQFINFFWTALGFAALFAYWFSAGLSAWFYLFIGLSIIPAFVSKSFVYRVQLSRNTKFYERLGVRFIRKFVQYGDFANRLARKSYPARPVIRQTANPQRYLSSIIMYERYHFICFIFFLLTSIMAMAQERYLIALLIVISNVVYNVCPILLQQFNRIRVLRCYKQKTI